MSSIDLKDGEVVVRAVAPQVRIGSEQVTTDGFQNPVKFLDIPEGAVAAMVQPVGEWLRYRKGGDTDPPTATAGIFVENGQLFPINGQLEDARFIPDDGYGTDSGSIEVEYYGLSESV